MFRSMLWPSRIDRNTELQQIVCKKKNLILTVRFVIPVVFIINYNRVNLLSNTTTWWRYIYIYNIFIIIT